MSTKEEKKPKGIEELGKLFSLDFDGIDEFILGSSIEKLKEELKEEVKINAIFITMPESKKIIALMKPPQDEEKTILMITPDDDGNDKIYKALCKIKEK
ncbi:MAG: hypothetical protein NUK62_08710 [Tenericutes bacterium]|nr:hypothetical protein [Mycoplasmatota bacterium]